MTVTIRRRRRSPNYPSKPLDWAVNSVLSILNSQGLHGLPPDVVASCLGYKNADSGPAKTSIAVLKSFGLLEKDGSKLRVSETVQRYKLAPSEDGKIAILKQWLTTPPLFQALLEKYGRPLPTDEVLVHDLVFEHKYIESAAKKIVDVLNSSIEFVPYNGNNVEAKELNIEEELYDADTSTAALVAPSTYHTPTTTPATSSVSSTGVRYPIRLAGGRMAYIEVPDDFYNKDKSKLKAQLEIIGTLDEDEDA